MMKPVRRFIRSLLLLPALLNLSCGGDEDEGGNGNPPEAAEATFVSEGATVLLHALLGPLAAGSYALKPGTPAGIEPAGDFGLTCPDITVTPGNSRVSVLFDYGSGCTSQLDGRMHSGSIALNLGREPASLGVVFNQYTAWGYQVSATIAGSRNGDMITMTIVSLSISDADESIVGDGVVTGTLDNGGTPASLLDDAWSLELFLDFSTTVLTPGAAGLIAGPRFQGQENRDYSVATTTPLRLKVGCRWPVSGKVSVTRTDGPGQLEVDFGNGECDNLATLKFPGEDPVTIQLGR